MAQKQKGVADAVIKARKSVWKSGYLYMRMSCPKPAIRSTVWSSSGRKSTICSSWCILSLYTTEICSGLPT